MQVGERTRVLLVEDDLIDRTSVARCLRRSHLNVEIVPAADAEEGRRLLASQRFDVALVDYGLPGEDGLSFLSGVMATGTQLPMILLTGRDDTGLSQECIQAGAQDYLVKGAYDESALERAILHAMERFSLQQALKERVETVEEQRLELEAKNEELQLITSALEERNRELQIFTSAAAHDLKAPLRRLQVFGKLLLNEVPGGPNPADCVVPMLSAVSRMAALVDDLLVLGLVDASDEEAVEVDLEEVAREAIEDLGEEIAREGAEVAVAPLISLVGESTQLRRLFQNLIGNGVKYRRPDVTPRVWVESTPATLRGLPALTLSVTDNGIGFEAAFAERIFLPFQRLHGEGTFQGTGLGLAICRKIVERHGGVIWARSQPGRGSVFSVTLPLQADAITTRGKGVKRRGTEAMIRPPRVGAPEREGLVGQAV